MNKLKKIELLAPARNLDAGRAAIDCGADAVYIGASRFGARVQAGNATGDIARLAEYAHAWHARVYVALNTLVYEDELAAAERLAREVVAAGADALIVQDMAYLEMGLEGVEFHASTQACASTPELVRFLGDSGFSRVILERGLTRDDILRIAAEAQGVELECFVHGAICVGYSGRCYMSRSLGPRSGNRGDCAQPCRLPYDLLDEGGRVVSTGKHLLSVRDLNLSEHLGKLIDAGVGSFKIEGRLKDTVYVRNVVAWYRRLIDEEIALRKGVERSSHGISDPGFEPDPSKSFSRGATDYYFTGKRSGMAATETPKAMGQRVGKAIKCAADSFVLQPGHGLAAGDGICFFAGDRLSGTNVNGVDGNTVQPARIDGILPGTEIFRNHDHVFTKLVREGRSRRTVDAVARVSLWADRVMLEVGDDYGFRASAALEGGFDTARDRPAALRAIETQVSRSGDTTFRIKDVTIESHGGVPFVPVSALNGLRREALAGLSAARSAGRPRPASVARDDRAAYPAGEDGPLRNVTNSLAGAFYSRHGVVRTLGSPDLDGVKEGCCIMTTPYCLRREMGECLLEKPRLKGPLNLRRDGRVFRLEFDCTHCEMRIFYGGRE